MTRAWDTVVDCAFVLLTTALVLSVLDRSFDTRAYLVVGLVPVAMLLVLAAVLRGREHGVWAYVIIALVAYPPLGALLALRDPGPLIIPTPASTGQVLAGHVTGPVEIASTLPPVVADGVVMVVPYAIGFLAGGGAAWLALATRRPLAPQLPLLAGLAAAIPLGVLTPNLPLGRGVLLGALWLLWGSLRARRGLTDLVGGTRWAWARPVAATLLVATTAAGVFLLLPDVGRDDRVLYQQDGLGDVDLGEVPSPVDKAGLLDNGKLLQTRGVPDRIPLRFVALDLYDGTAWTVAERSRGVREGGDTFRRIGPDITPVGGGREVRVDVRVFPGYTSDWLPLLGDLTSLNFEETNGRTQLREVRYNQATGSALVPGGLTPGDRYTFTALTNPPRLRFDDQVKRGALARQRPGAFLDVYLGPFRRGGRAPLDRLKLLMDHLRTDGYVRLGESSQTAAALGRLFLGADKMTATPHQYAATVALAAIRFGLTSRVVVGAAPDRRGAVRAADVRSWVEVQLTDGTWRSIPARRFLGTQGLVDAEEEPPPVPAAPDPDRADARGDRDDRAPKDRRDTPPTEEVEPSSRSLVATTLVVLAVSVVVLSLVLVPVLKVARRTRRRRAGGWSQVYVGGWQEVVDTARDRGTPVPEHLGRVQQARVLGHGTELAREADAAVFAPTQSSVEHRERFWGEADQLRRSLVSELPRRRRLLTWLSPASLLTSWARWRGKAPITPSTQEPAARPREPAGR